MATTTSTPKSIFETVSINRKVAAENITVNMKASSGELTMVEFRPTCNPYRTVMFDPTSGQYGAEIAALNVLNGLCDISLGKMAAYNESVYLFGRHAAEIYLDEALADGVDQAEAQKTAEEMDDNAKSQNPFAPKAIGMIHSDALRYGAVEIEGVVHTLSIDVAKLKNGWYFAETTRGSMRVTFARQQAQNKYDGVTAFLTGSAVCVKVFPFFRADGQKDWRLHNVARARVQTVLAMFEGRISRNEALDSDRERIFLRNEKRAEAREARREEKGLAPREVSTRVNLHPQAGNTDLDMLRRGLIGANKKIVELVEAGATIGVYSLAEGRTVNVPVAEIIMMNCRWNIKLTSGVKPAFLDFSNGNNGPRLYELVKEGATLQMAAKK